MKGKFPTAEHFGSKLSHKMLVERDKIIHKEIAKTISILSI